MLKIFSNFLKVHSDFAKDHQPTGKQGVFLLASFNNFIIVSKLIFFLPPSILRSAIQYLDKLLVFKATEYELLQCGKWGNVFFGNALNLIKVFNK
jgi:hypothetical protein